MNFAELLSAMFRSVASVKFAVVGLSEPSERGPAYLPAGMHSTLQWPVGRQACSLCK
jgi:hypothetical protein